MAEDDRKIESARKNWEERKLNPALKRGPERKPKFVTSSGIEVKRAYDPDDLNGQDFVNDLGFPGEYPFTRGVQPTMYRGRLWTMRQYAGFGSAEESNRRYRYLFDQGQTGLSVAFDLPTQMGRDSDHPLADGEVGRVGVPICSLADMETLLAELPLDKISTSMTINATASILLALYLVTAERRGVSWSKVNGTIQNDVLKEYVARGTYIYPPRGSMRIITDIFSFATKEVPNWNTISISGYHIREAGSTAAQELAFTIADGIAYVDAALKAGLQIDAFASRLSFFFNVHNNFFEEVAKFRAARRLWAKIMKERFGAKDERSMMMRFHAQTAGSTLTAQQVDNNVVRVTMQALAAVLGGAQSLHTNSKDEALALPTESSVLLALRTQQLIAHESDVADTDRSARRLLLRRAAHGRIGREGASSIFRRSTTSAVRSRQSSAATCSAKFRTRHSFTSARLKRSSESSSGSTSLLRAANRREIFCGSSRSSSRSRRRASRACVRNATRRRRPKRSRESRRRRATAIT